MPRPWPRLRGIVAVALLPALLPGLVHAQDLTVASAASIARSDSGGDSIDIVPGAKYQAGGLHRMLLGTGYRDLWATPLRVPVLDLKTFGGGLRPLQKSGGNQTKSLRFVTPSGTEYVFRSVDKEAASFPEGFKGTVVQTIARIRSAPTFLPGHSWPRRSFRPAVFSTSRRSSWSCPMTRGSGSTSSSTPTYLA